MPRHIVGASDTYVKRPRISSDIEKDLKRVGKELQRAREDAGLEQEEAAGLVGVSRVSLSRYENGKQRIPHDIAVKLTELYSKRLYADSASVPRGTVAEPKKRYGAGEDSWSPNPALTRKIPERAYGVALDYCRRLERAGWPREEIEQIERLMIDPRYAQANKRKGLELTEDEYIMLIDATWEAVKHSAAALGRQV